MIIIKISNSLLFSFNAVECNLTELTTKSTCIPLLVSGVLLFACARFPRVLRLRSVGNHYRDSVYSERFCVGACPQGCSPPPSLPLFPLFTSVTGACPPFHVGAHGWVARICQPWEWSPSRSWLPIVEASGCLRHPTSICDAVAKLDNCITD